MSAISLSDAPPGIDSGAWAAHYPGPPSVGDLWLLSWDGKGLGMGVISARLDTFVLVWPVSLPTDPVAPPAVEVANTPLGVALYPWPSRETGVGDVLLHRNLGSLLDAQVMEATAEAFDAGRPAPLPFAPDPALEARAEADAYSIGLIRDWEEICLLQWPGAEADVRLDAASLRSAGVRPSDIAKALDVGTSDAVQMFRGELPVSSNQAAALAAQAGTPADTLLAAGFDLRDVVMRLIDPSHKDRVLDVCAHLGVGESAARDRIVSEYGLAARATGGIAERLDGVYARLLLDR